MKTKQLIRNMMTRAAMTLLVMTTMTTTVRAQDPIAIYCDENKTLYFTYRDAEEIRLSEKFVPEGSIDPLNYSFLEKGANVTATGNRFPGWITNFSNLNYNPTRVVFESSFASVRPTSCVKWLNISSLTDIQGIENLNTSEVTNMSSMFNRCNSLTTLDLSGFDTKKVTDMSLMFSECRNLVSIIIGDGWDTSSVTSSDFMFNKCTSIVGYDGTTYDLYEGTNKTKAHAGTGGYMCKYNPFAVYCSDTKTLYFTTPIRMMTEGGAFTPTGSSSTQTITALWGGTDVTESGEYPAWIDNYNMRANATTVVIEPSFSTTKPASTQRWFRDFTRLSSIQGIRNLNTSEVTNMSAMFNGCTQLNAIDLTGLKTEKVTDMSSMFTNCTGLTILDLSCFDTSKLNEMSYMFKGCSNLESIYIGTQWNLTRVSNSGSREMFYGCTSIVGQDGTTYDSNATNKAKAHAGTGGYMRIYTTPLTLYNNRNNTSSLSSAMAANVFYDITLQDRTLYLDGCWNTLCLPFSLASLTGTPLEGFTVKELDTQPVNNGHATGFDSGTLYLNFKDATSIEAGKPYIVKKLQLKEDATTPTYIAKEGTLGWTTQQACGYDKLIDGQDGAGHCWWPSFSKGSAYCEFNADAPVYVTGYTLTTGNQNVNQDPEVWTLKARLNKSDAWTTIDNQTGSNALPSGRSTAKNYTVQNPGTYQYFRFEVTQNGGGSNMCLSELALQAFYPSDVATIGNPTFSGVTIDTAAPTVVTSEDGKVSFTGCYSPVPFEANDRTKLFLGAANTLYYPNAAMQIGSCRAYFQLNNGLVCGEPNQSGSGINNFVLNFGDETNSIENGKLKIENEAGAWYDLSGRRLSGKPTAKGIYINNGKKVVIK